MRQLIGTVVLVTIAIAGMYGGTVVWTAFGPSVIKSCPAPGVRPIGPEWIRVDASIGALQGPGDIRGSRVTWHRAATTDKPSRRLDLLRVDALAGAWGGVATVRGHQSRLVVSDEPASGGVEVWWDEGGLGCTIYGATLSGDRVTEGETTAIVEGLR